MKSVAATFGEHVFNETVMRERLPRETYRSLKMTMEQGVPLQPDTAQIIANAMKDWAIELGATHYTHWFQPMTGITAEKHEAFLSPATEGRAIMEFSGKELIIGESDASSFPSGGLRATFEARGYTTWDPTSYAFVKDGSLYIPTAFCSFSGEALDKKTPLLRSMEALNRQAMRILQLMNNPAMHVGTTVGPEQEYFLVDKRLYEARKDLLITGRTLFGAPPPKGQELEDHYYGNIQARVQDYMQELDEELWKLGVYAKTEHNEAAPGQHELAPIFTSANIAADHNQLTMEIMKKVANRRGMACLLHEKPFKGVNGSGKHNNWSMCTDLGENLLKPGRKPQENLQFLLFLCAVLAAVDEYGDLLRASAASAGNDHRLGGAEAPPPIISVFLGEQLTDVLNAVAQGDTVSDRARERLDTGVTTAPVVNRDDTDRNRTSPFAFTGNKFEFRMVGSSASISDTNTVINTIVAEVLRRFAEELEAAPNLEEAAWALIRRSYHEHRRIVFNGNNYSEEWTVEAKRRGLPCLETAVSAIPAYIDPKNVAVMTRHGILTEAEVHSRYEILLENYVKTVKIEALTMISMVRREIAPASLAFEKDRMEALDLKRRTLAEASTRVDKERLLRLCGLNESLEATVTELEEALAKARGGNLEKAKYYDTRVRDIMERLRGVVDALERLVPKALWPLPTYSELLFQL